MNQAIRITIMALLATTTAFAQAVTANTSYDHFAGWYEITVPDSAHGRFFFAHQIMLVPVIQRGTNFFTPFVGFEVPFENTDEGLYLKADNSYYEQRATLRYRPETGEYYAQITYRPNNYSYASSDHAQDGVVMCVARKIDRPSWLPATTDSAPATLDDYLGWYASLYLPSLLKMEVYKDNGLYFCRSHYPDDNSGTPSELIPSADGTKFMMDDAFSFCYNSELVRYELAREPKREPRVLIRHPLVRIDPQLPITTPPTNIITIIGFPFGKD